MKDIKKRRRSSIILFFFLLFILHFSPLLFNVEASEKTTVTGFRYHSSQGYTRVVIDIDNPVKFTPGRLSNPDRLYFDLKKCILPRGINTTLPIGDGILKEARVGQFDKQTVRVVLDVRSFEKFNVLMLKEPYRLVIDVYPDRKRASPGFSNGVKGPIVSPKIKQAQKTVVNNIKSIIIDPGHGGKDPGAVGPRRLYEKDVVLDVAKKLGKILKEKYNIEVIFTRDKDVFVSLEKRKDIANSKKADMFISIHTNSSRKRNVRGIETYLLNWTNDEEAMRVAARENKISLKKMKKVQGELQMILMDLARSNKRDESIRLAHSVQSSLVTTLKEDYRRIVNLGVKQALFYVLVGVKMPSILIEVSFISNREEERRLSKNNYRYKIARAIAKGVEGYIAPAKLVKKTNDSL